MNYSEVTKKRKDSYTGSEIVNSWLRQAYDLGASDFKEYGIPDIETVSALVHEAWMKTKSEQGITTRLAEDGEELMKPYQELSEKAKDLDRNTVKAVYQAIEKAMK